MQSMIFGAGSLGTILGALLTEGGADVTLVSRNEAHIRALQQKGATITGTMEKCVPVKACLPEELHGSYDLILLMTKQLDNPGNVVRLLPRLREGGGLLLSAEWYSGTLSPGSGAGQDHSWGRCSLERHMAGAWCQ